MEETRRRTFLNWASRISHVKRVDHHALLLLPDYYMAMTTWQRLFREEWSRLFPRNLLRSDYTVQTIGSYVARNQGTRGRCEEAEGREGKGREGKRRAFFRNPKSKANSKGKPVGDDHAPWENLLTHTHDCGIFSSRRDDLTRDYFPYVFAGQVRKLTGQRRAR